MKTYNIEVEDTIIVVDAATFDIIDGVLIFWKTNAKQIPIAAINKFWKRVWIVEPTGDNDESMDGRS